MVVHESGHAGFAPRQLVSVHIRVADSRTAPGRLAAASVATPSGRGRRESRRRRGRRREHAGRPRGPGPWWWTSQTRRRDRSTVSALGHFLGESATVDPSRGLFLDHTWCMHPNICAFTTERFYEGRLRPPSAARSPDGGRVVAAGRVPPTLSGGACRQHERLGRGGRMRRAADPRAARRRSAPGRQGAARRAWASVSCSSGRAPARRRSFVRVSAASQNTSATWPSCSHAIVPSVARVNFTLLSPDTVSRVPRVLAPLFFFVRTRWIPFSLLGSRSGLSEASSGVSSVPFVVGVRRARPCSSALGSLVR